MPTKNRFKSEIAGIKLLLATAEREIRAAEDAERRYAWMAINDHLHYALECLERKDPQLDAAGAHLKAAHEIMVKEVQA